MLAQADGGEDQPDLTAGDHAQADQALVARRADRSERRDQLAQHGHREQRAGDAQHGRTRELTDLRVDADLQEEHGDEEVPDRRELALDPVGGRAAREGHACHERAHDRRELSGVGQLRERERERERRRNQRARRSGVAVEELEHAGAHPRPHRRRDHEERDRDEDDAGDVED